MLGRQIYELAVLTDTGQPTTMQQLAGSTRVDLRFGADSLGELYVLSKAARFGRLPACAGRRRRHDSRGRRYGRR